MEQEKQNGLGCWDNYISGSFLKAINVENENDVFVCISVEVIEEETPRLRTILEKQGTEWQFDLNKTNASKAKELGIQTPKDLIGKKIFFKKVLVRNPTTNQEVDGLRIYKIG